VNWYGPVHVQQQTNKHKKDTNTQKDKHSSITVELWLRGRIDTLEAVFQAAPRNFHSLRRAETLAIPETECLLYATFWLGRCCLELIGAAAESAAVNRDRALRGPVKVVVTAGGGSNPCWSTWESQVRPAERQRAPTKREATSIQRRPKCFRQICYSLLWLCLSVKCPLVSALSLWFSVRVLRSSFSLVSA